MTKADIINDLYERLGYSKRECANIVESLFDIIKEALSRGENVKISGFGNFVLRDKKERKGRNPKTGEEMIISKRRVLNFKLSQVLKEAMNQK
ncbi:MAG: integration host factor subunit alpha [Deltaproteobacteria bacterium]|nr:integration host factor subunit alpha [Deltaproteobacteria bacterium]